MEKAGDNEDSIDTFPSRAQQVPAATLTVSELRTAVKQHLRQTGALRTLKTQLRGMMLQGIMQSRAGQLCLHNRSHVAPHGGTLEGFEASRQAYLLSSSPHTSRQKRVNDTVKENDADDTLPTRVAWARHVADALVVNHLRRVGCVMSLALFSTEAEVLPLSDAGSPAAEEAYLQQLLLSSSSRAHSHTLPSHMGTGDEEATTRSARNATEAKSKPPQHEHEHLSEEGDETECEYRHKKGHTSTTVSGQMSSAPHALPQRSVLQYVVEQHLRRDVSAESVRWRADPVRHCGTQTYTSHFPPAATTTRTAATAAAMMASDASGYDRTLQRSSSSALPPPPRSLLSCDQERGTGCRGAASMSLECKLAAVNAQYALRWSSYGQASEFDGNMSSSGFFLRQAVERRLQQYKDDMHEQLREEYAQKHATLEQTRLQEVRDAAEARWTVFVQTKQEELIECERSLRERVEQERAQIRQERIGLAAQRERLDTQRRQIQEQLRAQEEAMSSQLSVQRELYDKLHTLQLQASQWEEMATARLLEVEAARERVARSVHEHRRLSEEHAKELAMRDEEADGLRRRIRALLARKDEVDPRPPCSTVRPDNTAVTAGDGNNDNTRDSSANAYSGSYSHGYFDVSGRGAGSTNDMQQDDRKYASAVMSRGGAPALSSLHAASGLNTSRARDDDDAHAKEDHRIAHMPGFTRASGAHAEKGRETRTAAEDRATVSSSFSRFPPHTRLATDTHTATRDEHAEVAGGLQQTRPPQSSPSRPHASSSTSSTSRSQSLHADGAELNAPASASDAAVKDNDNGDSERPAPAHTSRNNNDDDSGTRTSSSAAKSNVPSSSSSSETRSSSHDTNDGEGGVEADRRHAALREGHERESSKSELAASEQGGDGDDVGDNDATSAAAAESQRLREQEAESQREERQSLLRDEERERAELVNSADADRRGIEWIETSQRDAIAAADRAAQEQLLQATNVASGGGDDDAFFAALAVGNDPLAGDRATGTSHAAGAARTEAQHDESNTTDNSIFFDDPSGGDEDDAILFGRRSPESSSSSF